MVQFVDVGREWHCVRSMSVAHKFTRSKMMTVAKFLLNIGEDDSNT